MQLLNIILFVSIGLITTLLCLLIVVIDKYKSTKYDEEVKQEFEEMNNCIINRMEATISFYGRK